MNTIKRMPGFTLVEVVVVLILIGILAVSVASKFSGTSEYESYNYRARLISALRLTQQRAMQQTKSSYCHQIVFEDKRYGVPDRTNCAVTSFPVSWQPDATGEVVETRYSVTFNINGAANPKIISFDAMGKPLSNCAGGCLVNIVEPTQTVQIKIESEGYIHAI